MPNRLQGATASGRIAGACRRAAPGPRTHPFTGMSVEDVPVFRCMSTGMGELLEHLWALRGLDEEVATLHAALERFPEQRRALEQRIADERGRLDRLKSRLGALQLGRRQIEKDIEALADQERKFQGQLPAVKKNEEYTALLKEIATTKAKRSDLETDVLVRLEEEEEIQAQRPGIEAAVKTAEHDAAERTRQIDAEEQVDRARLAELEAERKLQIEGLDAVTRGRYERIRASRDARAVVPILKGACGGCYRAQPPQVMQEARRRDRPLVCDGCGRMLILPPEAI